MTDSKTADAIPVQNGARLTILIVDAMPHSQSFLKQLVERIGHRCACVSSSDAAYIAVETRLPDLVIADIDICADSTALVRGLKASSPNKKLWILLKAGETEEMSLIRGLAAGADDHIPKPVRFAVLAAKIGSIARNKRLTDEIELRNRELAAYQSTEEREARIAQHVISRVINREYLEDPALNYWVRPAGSYFSGDMVLAARTPTGDLHVMLADATGHGLSAALSALPVAQPFYAMTEKGFSVEQIAAEISRKISNMLPIERFVAASLISVNFREQIISVWNGGNPVVRVVDADGNTLFVADSKHLPLGVADEQQFSRNVDIYRYNRPCQIIAHSDGLAELSEEGGIMLGADGVERLLAGTAPGDRMAVLQSAVDAVLGARDASDDIALVLIDCEPVARMSSADIPAPGDVRVNEAHGNWKLAMSFSADELKYIDVVPLLLNMVNSTACGKRSGRQLFVVVSELFNNALDHGVLELDSRIKLEEDGFSRYLDLRQQRLQELGDARIDVSIEVVESGDRPMLRILVRDSGRGFDFASTIRNATDSSNPFGRGISTVRSLCRDVRFSGCGNEVVAYFAIACSDRQSCKTCISSPADQPLPVV